MNSERYLSDEAVELATDLLQRGRLMESSQQRRLNRRVSQLIKQPEGMRLLVDLADQVLRVGSLNRAGRALQEVISQRDLQQLGDPLLRYLLRGLGASAKGISPLLVPLVKSLVRTLSQQLLIDGSYQSLRQHLDERMEQNFRVDLNWLGELVLGEEEAAARLAQQEALLKEPYVTNLSIKLSTLCSQLHPLAFEADLERASIVLRTLYRAAIAADELCPNEKLSPKLISLDMEEAHLVELTLRAFQEVLSEPEFIHCSAGITLQAYLPESFARQRELTAWAQERVAHGGAPIRLRLVKGANLAWERVQAEQKNWPNPVFEQKLEVDANFKRMAEYALVPERMQAVQLSLGSHNLFDVAWAQLVAREQGLAGQLQLECLEGMANGFAQAAQQKFGLTSLYAPAVKREQFSDAIAYLTRRLDENTQSENFLRHIFDLDSSTRPWRRQEEHFRNAVRERLSVSELPRHQELRVREERIFALDAPFAHEPVTDFSLAGNRQWVKAALDNWSAPEHALPVAIAAQSEGEELVHELPAYEIKLANEQQVEAALSRAALPSNPWRERRLPERKQVLIQAAGFFAKSRGELLTTVLKDTGMGVEKADAEVSLAIDLLNHALRGLDELPANLVTKPAGAVVVVAHMSEPLASCVGAVAAALVGGNSVILRPDLGAALSAYRAVELFWKAGVPREALQFVPTAEDKVGLRLLTDERVARLVFVGATEDAQLFLQHNPCLPLLARVARGLDQGSMLISACADMDLVIEDLLKSAFAHPKQSKSACFVALVEKSVVQGGRFLEKLADAVQSLRPTALGDLEAKAARRANFSRQAKKACQALPFSSELEGNAYWLVQPQLQGEGEQQFWSAGVMAGLRAGDALVDESCLVPFFAVVEVEDLHEGMEWQKAQATAGALGFQSLSEREKQAWLEQVLASTRYMNKPLSAAMVQRQPFGGGQGILGMSAKWGGRNFVWQFVDWQETGLPWEVNRLSQRTNRLLNALAGSAQESFVLEELSQAASSYSFWQAHEFALQHEVGGLQSERNLFGYRALQQVAWRVSKEFAQDANERLSLARFALACSCLEANLVISAGQEHPLLKLLASHEGIELRIETEAQLAENVKQCSSKVENTWELLRAAKPIGIELLRVLHQAGISYKQGQVLAQGRVELLSLHQEQLVAETRHRHGHLLEEAEMSPMML